MSLINDMKAKMLDIINPDIKYSVEDFNKEFANTATTDAHLININLVNTSNNPTPEYATAGSSGFDLRASLTESITIPAGQRAIVPTGLFFEIPANFEITVRSRSGLAVKNGVVVLNSPGTIDADYRGEIKVILINHSTDDFIITNGDRIAQAVISSVIGKTIVKLTPVDQFNNTTERGEKGFGSSGVK